MSEELDGVEWGFLRECKIDQLEEVAQDSATAAKLWDVSMTLVGEKGVEMVVMEGEDRPLEEQGAVLEEEGVFVEEDQGVSLEDEGIILEDEGAVVEERQDISEGELSSDEEPSSGEDDLLENGSVDADDGELLLQQQQQLHDKSK